MRETFGINDPLTKKPYKDVLKSFLEIKIIYGTSNYIFPKEVEGIELEVYKLSMDSKVKKALKESSPVKCIVSFQTRSDIGNVAIARLFDDTKPPKILKKEGK